MTATNLKISDLIVETLGEQIIRGDRAPGEKLRQDYIARDFETSHVPVREALLQLVAQGLAVSEHRRGIRVAPLDDQSAVELKVMRQALEPLALTHSVPNMTPAQIAAAESARLACDAAEDVFAWEEANRAFHLATSAGCGMPRLIAEIDNLQRLYARHFLKAYGSRWQQREDRDHKAIMVAIRDRDAPRAVAVLKRHLTRL